MMSEYTDEKKLLVVAMENSKRRGIFFSALAVAKIVATVLVELIFILFRSTDNAVYSYVQYAVGGAVIILLILIECRSYGIKFTQGVRLKFFEPKYCFLAVLLFVGMVFGLFSLNDKFIEFLKTFGYKHTEIQLPELNVINYIFVVLTVCVVPAICEEFALRGFILSGIDGVNKIAVAAVTGFLFAIYHHRPAQTIYQFIVGFCFALLAIESKTVILTSVVHFLNNFLIVNVYYFAGGVLDFGKAGNVIATVIGLISLAVFLFFTLKRKKSDIRQTGTFASQWLILRSFIFAALLGIVAYIALWIAELLI